MAVTFRNRIGGWTLLADNLKPKLGDMPELTAPHAELEKTIADAQALFNEQEDLKSRLLKTLRTRQSMERKGQDQTKRLAASLKGKLGFTAEELLSYGIKLQKAPNRKKKDKTNKKAAPAQGTASPHPEPAATPATAPATTHGQ